MRRAVSIVMTHGEPQIWGASEAMSAIRVPRTRRENTVQQRDATLPGGDLGLGLGPHLDQNVLAGYAAVALALILDPSGGLFSDAARPCQRPAPPLWRKRGTRKSRLETKTENEASFSPSSASLVTPTPAKPRQPRGKSHPSLQCHNWPDWVADGAVWRYPVSAGNPETQVGTCLMAHTGDFCDFCDLID